MHEGRPFTRTALVRLFSTVLRRDGDRYYLVTPHEKLAIEVEDAPFLAVDFVSRGTGTQAARSAFAPRTDDVVFAGPGHAVWIERGCNRAEALCACARG